MSTRLATLFPAEEFELLLKRTHRCQRNLHNKFYRIELGKIRHLTTSPRSTQPPPWAPFPDSVINLSPHTFTRDELTLLKWHEDGCQPTP